MIIIFLAGALFGGAVVVVAIAVTKLRRARALPPATTGQLARAARRNRADLRSVMQPMRAGVVLRMDEHRRAQLPVVAAPDVELVDVSAFDEEHTHG
ncbi:MAG: hypothetical protein ABR520_11390 [Mycobacteriales bacterium]|nr:hypothetical protein [Actinomycetota bacterium]